MTVLRNCDKIILHLKVPELPEVVSLLKSYNSAEIIINRR